MTYASNGPGGAAHLFAELIGGELGIKMVHVPYKGLRRRSTTSSAAMCR